MIEAMIGKAEAPPTVELSAATAPPTTPVIAWVRMRAPKDL
ncbi:MAG TPA: hypothetical protein VLW50_21825 [Streptosporangiaceae bacterium]|nr:hypothetical protein [Streptosporangiaceae bacterium]